MLAQDVILVMQWQWVIATRSDGLMQCQAGDNS